MESTIKEEAQKIINKFTYWGVTYCDQMGREIDFPYSIMSALIHVDGVLDNIVVHSEEARLRKEKYLKIKEYLEIESVKIKG